MGSSPGDRTNELAQCLRVAAFGVLHSAFPLAFRFLAEDHLERIEERMDEALVRVLKGMGARDGQTRGSATQAKG